MQSCVKWLAKSFMSRKPKIQTKIQQIESSDKINENINFRNRQINKFMIKGFIHQLDQQQYQKDQGWEENVNSILGITNKINFEKSKKKLLEMNASNAADLLEDTINQLNKKSDYINKYVRLKESYETNYKIQQYPTSQAILQSSLLARKDDATEKFKILCDRLIKVQNARKIQKKEFGIQVEPIITQAEKNKKIAEKNKLKQLTEDLQKQRNNVKSLRLQLQVVQKKYTNLIRQNNDLQNSVKKKVVQISRIKSRMNTRQQKTYSNQKSRLQDIRQTVKQTQKNIKQEKQTYGQIQRKIKFLHQRVNSVKSLKNINSYAHLSEDEINKSIYNQNQNQNQKQKLAFERQIFNIQVYNNHWRVRTNKIKTLRYLQLQIANVCDLLVNDKTHICMNISNYKDKRVQTNGSCTKQQEDPLKGSNSKYLLKNKKFYTPQFESQVTSTPNSLQNQKIGYHHITRFSKTGLLNSKDLKLLSRSSNSNFKIMDKKKMMQAYFTQHKTHHQVNSYNLQIPFDKIYKVRQLAYLNLTSITINNFFITEDNAKNYQFLNISEMFSNQKKNKIPARRIKSSFQKNPLTFSSKGLHQNTKQSKSQPSHEIENVLVNILTKKMYAQLQNIKKYDKDIYLKIIIFLRFPHSAMIRYTQLLKQANENEQGNIDIVQLLNRIKRIFNFHRKCNQQNQNNSPTTAQWCEHKQFILQFFGFQPIQQDYIFEEKLQDTN